MKTIEYYMNIAALAAERSTCLRRHIGSVAVKGDRIMATGRNGQVSGTPHCKTCLREELNIPSGQDTNTCLRGSTKIKLLSGESVPICDLVGKDVWGYAYDKSTGEVVPAYIRNVRSTGIKSLLVIHLHDNTEIHCTADHRLLLRDGSYCEAQSLQRGHSLMATKWKMSDNPHYEGKYEEIFHPSVRAGYGNRIITEALKVLRYLKDNKIPINEANYSTYRYNRFRRSAKLSVLVKKGYIKDFDDLCRMEAQSYGLYELTHVMVTRRLHHKLKTTNKLVCTHHKDINTLNNDPENLQLVTMGEHRRLHSVIENRPYEFYLRIGKKGADAQREKLKVNKDFRDNKKRIGQANFNALWGDNSFREYMRPIQVASGKEQVKRLNSSKEILNKRTTTLFLQGITNLCSIAPIKVTADNYERLREQYIVCRHMGVSAPRVDNILKYFGSLVEAIECAYDYNHKVTSVEPIAQEEVFDFTVDTFENCLVDLGNNSGIFAHNCKSVHSEANLLVQAALHGINLTGSTIYVTNKPCFTCVKLLASIKPTAIIYQNEYPDPMTDRFLEEANWSEVNYIQEDETAYTILRPFESRNMPLSKLFRGIQN